MSTPAIDDAETQQVRRIWERDAPIYDRLMSRMERMFFGGGREWVCSKATGEVLEIAVGTGRNLGFYSPGVRLTGVDLSPSMLTIAKQRAEELAIPVGLREADAQQLPFPDATFDTVVCTLALCSIPDDRRAVSEVKRVLRPGGRFLLMEHVRSPILPVRIIEQTIEWITFRREHDHMTREPLTQLRAEGFLIDELERLKAGIVERIAARRAND